MARKVTGLCEICLAEVAADRRRCDQCAAELLEQLDRMAERGELAPADDDEVLEWWEAFDAGATVEEISLRFLRPARMVLAAFEDLGVLERFRREDESKSDMLNRLKRGDFSDAENRIMDALAKLAPDFDTKPMRSTIPYARSLQHMTPKRGAVVMSGRQRQQDKMVGGVWGLVVRADLKAAGLLSGRVLASKRRWT